MKHWRFLSSVLLAWSLVACSAPLQNNTYLEEYGCRGGRGQGFRSYPYIVTQEPHACVPGKISGRITCLRSETFSQGMEPGLALAVQTPNKGLVHVHLGPLWLLERHMPDLNEGDEVTLQTLCYNFAGQERLLAGEATHNGTTLSLLNSQGQPYWEAGQTR